MSFEPLSRILRQTVPHTPIAKDIQIARVFHAWEEALLGAWGKEKAAFVATVSFREGALAVDVTSPAAAQQLATDLTRIQNETNRRLGGLVVKAVRIRRKGF